MNDITLRNRQWSPFLRLPGEIRECIYELVLGGKQVLVLSPRLYSADKTRLENHLNDSFEPDTVRKLLYLTETCRQIHVETKFLIFKTNEFRIASNYSFKTLLDKLSQQQAAAIQTLMWPKRCHQVSDDYLMKFTGLQRLVVLQTGQSGDDFYIPENNATRKVHLWYQKRRQAAQDRINAWEAHGIEIEYCE
ncbi:hypothetical protein EKO04_004295 [Ascochyta lentis]|uniref:DUF7730 domain-containing protein n=1 Tax=Ascochyta lentis TaxID=205686 RepID=A0A8H7MJK0_9PLEO|nr:hypothetical protein EKO04_004295 [Ascochyta lentis]